MSITEDYEVEYEGTEPINDAIENYRSTMLVKLLSEKYKSK